MNTNRRKFLRNISLGAGAVATGIPTLANAFDAATDEQMQRSSAKEQTPPRFNMCGYAAPKLDVVRVGIIGLGMRGMQDQQC